MAQLSTTSQRLFKGIALFTPGGSLVYCIDPNRRDRWHLHLCAFLGDLLGLSEPPHFLVPCYTATVDRWLDPDGQVQTVAEAAPAVLKYQAFLNVVFETGDLVWQPMSIREGLCDSVVLASYRKQFAQLWESQDLVACYDRSDRTNSSHFHHAPPDGAPVEPQEGYVLRLFVAGSTLATEQTLQILHQVLEQPASKPYTLKIIDVTKRPELAEQDQISATPTLVKVWPRPVRRVVGNLERADQVLWLLDLADWNREFS